MFSYIDAKMAGLLTDPQTGPSIRGYCWWLQSRHEGADRSCPGEEPQSPPEGSRPTKTRGPEPSQRGPATLSEPGFCPLWAEKAAEQEGVGTSWEHCRYRHPVVCTTSGFPSFCLHHTTEWTDESTWKKMIYWVPWIVWEISGRMLAKASKKNG